MAIAGNVENLIYAEPFTNPHASLAVVTTGFIASPNAHPVWTSEPFAR